jgi:uncharacterized coiled-coil DUF342 family protein
LKLHYEQQSALIEEIKALRKKLSEEQRLTTRYRKQRDRYKSDRKELLKKAAPEIDSQESKKDVLEKLSKRRDFLKRQAQRTDGPVFKILSQSELERLTLVELKYHLYELEFKQQTSSLSREDEDILIEEIKRIEDRIALLEKKDEVIVADYLGNVPESREKMEKEIHELERQISREASDRREVNIRVQKLYSRIRPLKEEEDKAHGEFVKHLQSLEELKIRIDTKQEEVDSIKAKIAKFKKLIAEEEHKQIFGKIEEKIQTLIERRDKGESLSPEEQEFLMSYGHVPF